MVPPIALPCLSTGTRSFKFPPMGTALCKHVFQNTMYLIRDLMADGAVPSNLSVPKVPEPDRAAWGARSTFPHEAEPQQGLLLCKVIIGSLHRTVL